MTLAMAEKAYLKVFDKWVNYIRSNALQGPSRITAMCVQDKIGVAPGAGGSIEFIDHDSWVGGRYKANGGTGNAAKAEALTYDYGAGGKIIVHKGYYTFGSLVHEYLHILSHPEFRRQAGSNLNEGVTEYLTRMTHSDEYCALKARYTTTKDGNVYGDLCDKIAEYMKSSDLDKLCKSYFRGEELWLKTIEEMMKFGMFEWG